MFPNIILIREGLPLAELELGDKTLGWQCYNVSINRIISSNGITFPSVSLAR